MRYQPFKYLCAIAALSSTFVLFAADERCESQEVKQEWGNLSATFIYDGEPPEPRQLKIDKDQGFYKDPIFDPSLVVDQKSKGIANVAIWLVIPTGKEQPPIHASYAELAKQDVVLDTVKGQIEPHICLVWTPQTLLIKNSEPIGHNHSIVAIRNMQPNAVSALIPAGGPVRKKFRNEESSPSPIACVVHPWENGLLMIRGNPYMAVSNTVGKLQIKNLPVGAHNFRLWHELTGLVKEAKRGGKVEKIEKGWLTVEIKPGENDLGEFVIKPTKEPAR